MREVKFRGRSGLTWHEGELHQGPDYTWIDDYVVDPGTVGQSTGLKDMSNRDIYEGDIIDLIKNDELCDAPCCVRWHPYLTQFYLCFSQEDYPGERDTKASLGKMIYQHGYRVKILGNIYDNPDLLPKLSPYMIGGGR